MIYNIDDFKQAELVMSYEQWEEEHKERARKARAEKIKWYVALGAFALANVLAIAHWLYMVY